jgi:hypothetical protein
VWEFVEKAEVELSPKQFYALLCYFEGEDLWEAVGPFLGGVLLFQDYFSHLNQTARKRRVLDASACIGGAWTCYFGHCLVDAVDWASSGPKAGLY